MSFIDGKEGSKIQDGNSKGVTTTSKSAPIEKLDKAEEHFQQDKGKLVAVIVSVTVTVVVLLVVVLVSCSLLLHLYISFTVTA